MPITSSDIRILKEPFGILIKDEDLTKEKIKDVLNNAKKVVSVGDSTTDRLISYDILPNISVVDNRERRRKRKGGLHNQNTSIHELYCTNPAGSICREAVSILNKALRISTPVKVVVYGEEDMLALPIIAVAPYHTFVLYGQPLEGIVVVTITPEMRKKAKGIIDKIGIT